MANLTTKETFITLNSIVKELFWPSLSLVVLAVVSGVIFNLIRSQGSLPLDFRPGQPDPSLGLTEITQIDELERLTRLPGVITLDARSTDLYSLGHLPGAISLPAEELENRLGPFLSQVGDPPLIICYCSESLCPLAERLATALARSGLKNIYLFRPGFDHWLDLGKPIEK
jgi:rhodanese-related sulfurtransferase